MAVLLNTDQGALIDHALLLKRVYSNVEIDSKQSGSYLLKTNLFKIDRPFKMDSQVLAEQTAEGKGIPRRNRKRKRKSELNVGEVEAQLYHSEIVQRVLGIHTDLISKAKEAGYIQEEREHSHSSPGDVKGQTNDSVAGGGHPPVSKFSELDNNSAARDAARIRVGDTSLIDVCQAIAPPDNVSSTSREMSQKYMDKFDLIVLDPPWQNKSVKRKKMYGSLRDEDLLDISLEDLAAPGCLVVVWVTNRMKHIKFVKDTLFPKWSVAPAAEWQWLKITKYGKMIYDISSNHKKPYEILLMGHFEGSIQQGGLRNLCSAEGKRKKSESFETLGTTDKILTKKDSCELTNANFKSSNEADELTNVYEGRELRSLPCSYVIMSVPCALHSVKPPLDEVLKRYLKENPRCLELFARNMWPNWTSWGNEVYVLLHQHVDFYDLQ
uniref:Methyltransferase-like protein 4 isoform X3 n=1 Tax=Crassostrea virginica TaxID=6565 RepID=A0A8B8CV72_CRAVI|nr:methyltransferase-like protein 4 isoform X3 [Crassostrea virginica]